MPLSAGQPFPRLFPPGRLLAALVLSLLTLSACGPPADSQRQAWVFGTLVDITIPGQPPGADTAMAAVLAEFDRLHRHFHPWQPGPLHDLNSALAEGRDMAVDPETRAILLDARRWHQRSGGLFNPAIGQLIRLWGFQSDAPASAPPDPRTVAALLAAQPDMDDLHLDGDRVSSSNPATAIDLGGYLKGYALDRAADILVAQGVDSALINIGGNIRALGQRPDRLWRVAIRDPRKPMPMALLELRPGEAIGTSGDYQRFFEHRGRRYSHLIDPRNGQPARESRAATVLADRGVDSDVASKPLFIAGPRAFPRQLQRLGLDRALLVDARGDILITPELAERLEFTEPDVVFRIVAPDGV